MERDGSLASPPEVRRTRPGSPPLLHLALWSILTLWLCTATLLPNARVIAGSGGAWVGPRGLSIVDFPFHFHFASRVWKGRTTVQHGSSIYSLENHLGAVREWSDRPASHTLHFGYSPTMIWLLAVLLPLSPALAYLAFNLAGLIGVWWVTHPSRCLPWGLLCFATPLAHACVLLGQTAFLTGTALLFLAQRCCVENRETWRDAMVSGTVLWTLTAKPPLALAAGAVLVGSRRWRTLTVAAAGVLIATLVLWPMLGDGWVRDYLRVIRAYNLVDAGPAWAWAVAPSQMANLRGVLSCDLSVPDNLASLISGGLWLLALVWIAAPAASRSLAPQPRWALTIVCYLLLCPHITSTEELQLALLIPLCLPRKGRLRRHEAVLLILVPLLLLASPALGPLYGHRLPLFCGKLALGLAIALKLVPERGRMRDSVEGRDTPCPTAAGQGA